MALDPVSVRVFPRPAIPVSDSDARLSDERTPLDDSATNAKLANMAQATIKGRASGAGTGDPQDLTAAQVRTILNVEDGADVTDAANVGSAIHGASTKATPVDADEVGLIDSAASNALKRLTWANTKATLKTYLDTIYQPVSSVLTNTTASFTSALNTKLAGIEASADVTDNANVGAAIVAGATKATLVAGDRFAILDSENSFALGDATFSSLRASQSEASAMSIDTKWLTPASLPALVADLVPITRRITFTGLADATTSGLLSSDFTVNVPVSTNTEAVAGESDAKANTPLRSGAMARAIGSPAWPGRAPLVFSQSITGIASDRAPLSIGTIVNDDTFGLALQISGSEIPADPGYVDIAAGDFPLPTAGKVKVRWLVRRSDDAVDPSGEGVDLRIQNLNKNGNSVSNVRFGETAGDGVVVAGGDTYAPVVADDPIDVSIVVSRGADFDVDYVVPATTRSISPHLRLYGSTGAVRIALISCEVHNSVPEFLGDVEAALDAMEATAAAQAADAATAEASAAAAAATLASLPVTREVALADAVKVQTAARDLDDPEIHGPAYFTDRGSLVFGGVSAAGDNLLPNQSVVEIKYINDATLGSGVPMTIGEWNPSGAAVEPVIFRRSRGSEIGITGAGLGEVQAGDSIFTLQGQVDDGLGTDNLAVGNIGMRVQSGTTPIPGDLQGYAGNAFIALSPGDGTNPIRTVMEWQSDGDVNAVVGKILMNNTAVISQSRWAKFVARLADPRAAVADDAIYTLAIPGGATAIVRLIGTTVAATTPAVMFACRTDSAAIELMSVSSAAEAAGNVLVATASGAVTDHTLYTDAKLTIVASDDGNVYLVNRLGASKTYGYHIEINSATL